MITRRQFNLGAAALAFAGLSSSVLGKTTSSRMMKTTYGFGPLVSDPNKLLDLPAGFSYKVISKFKDKMSDKIAVPDRADGMGCLPLGSDKVALIRNHELHPNHIDKQPLSIRKLKSEFAYDTYDNGIALPGGTSTIVYNTQTGKTEQEYLSLIGTVRNCAGGVTPWGTWLTCEESVDTPSNDRKQYHGYVFEVSANQAGLTKPVPLKAMGRFNHEAAAVDPQTGIVYLTEDRGDSLFYRFIPNQYGQLEKGGKLQAMVINSTPKFDTRNWEETAMTPNQWYSVSWVDITNPDSPEDDLRVQGYQDGAALFARGEGIHLGDNEFYFCCTNGGKKQLGQIMRYRPSPNEGNHRETKQPGQIQIFLESEDKSLYNFGDNLTVTPFGHLLVCEDQYTDVVDNHLRGVNEKGEVYAFAKLHLQTELAGACFSPDGETLFVNVYSPTKTLAITGPWGKAS